MDQREGGFFRNIFDFGKKRRIAEEQRKQAEKVGMLHRIYQSAEEINKRVMRLGFHFELEGLGSITDGREISLPNEISPKLIIGEDGQIAGLPEIESDSRGKTLILAKGLEQMSVVANDAEAFARGVAVTVELASAGENEFRKRRISSGDEDLGDYQPAELKGRFLGEPFSFSEGLAGDNLQNKVQVIVSGKTAYILSSTNADSERPSLDGQTALTSLKKVDLTSSDENPLDAAKLSLQITTDDLDYLGKLPEVLRSCSVAGWRWVNRKEELVWGKGREQEKITNEISEFAKTREQRRRQKEWRRRDEEERNERLNAAEEWIFEWTDESKSMPLSAEQIAARKKIYDFVKAGQRNALMLYGVSGIGKTVMTDLTVKQWIKDLGGETLYASELSDQFFNLKDHNNPLIFSITINEIEDVKKRVNDREIEEYVMKGMTLGETEALFQRLLKDKTTEIPMSELVSLSMGVPMLIEVLASDPAMDRERAMMIVQNYLESAWKARKDSPTLEKYLHIHSPGEVIENLGNNPLDQRNKYIASLMKSRAELLKEFGVLEELPDLKNEILYTVDESESEQFTNKVDIFIPELTQADYFRLGEALGFLDISHHLLDKKDFFLDATRLRMFGLIVRKMALWIRPNGGETVVKESEESKLDNLANKLALLFGRGELPLKPSGGQGLNSVAFNKHEHRGMSEPIQCAHMLESLLQQRGISYITINRRVNKTYFYDPVKQKAEEFDIPKGI